MPAPSPTGSLEKSTPTLPFPGELSLLQPPWDLHGDMPGGFWAQVGQPGSKGREKAPAAPRPTPSWVIGTHGFWRQE